VEVSKSKVSQDINNFLRCLYAALLCSYKSLFE
jgi:hypothetical protein